MPPVFVENQEKIVPGVGGFVCSAAVDQDRPLAGGGNFELANQPCALHIVRRAFVVVVEADLAAGDDFRLGEKAVEFGQRRVVGFRRVVGIDAGAGVEPGHAQPAPLNSRQRSSAWCISAGPSPMPMESTAPTPASCSADQHGRAVVGIALAVEVSVGID